MCDLILLNIPSEIVGIWLGASGRKGTNFLGFQGIQEDQVILLRTEHNVSLIHINQAVVVRRWEQNEKRFVAVNNFPLNYDRTFLIPAHVTNWSVNNEYVSRMGLKLDENLTNVIFPGIDLSDFRSNFQKQDDFFYVAEFELAFALFACLYSLEAFESWKIMLKIFELSPSIIPLTFLRALSIQLGEIPEENFEENENFRKDLFRICKKLVERSESGKPEVIALEIAILKNFKDIDKLLHKDEEEGDAPTVVLTGTVLQLSDSSNSSNSFELDGAERMSWML